MASKIYEYVPEQFDVFSNRAMIWCVKEASIEEYSPLNTTDNANSLEFLSLPYNEKYKDLSWVYLKLRLQILKKNGESYKTGDTEQPYLVQNALHSIFKSAYVTLNNNVLRTVEQNYSHKEFIEGCLNFSKEHIDRRLSAQHFSSDEKSLNENSSNSKIFELYGRINLLNLSKLMLPGVGVSFRFHLDEPDKYIKEKASNVTKNGPSILKIHGSKLYIRHVIPSNEIILAHERLLASNRNAIYEYKRSSVITQNLAKDSSNLEIVNMYSGPRPSLILFGMLEHDSFSGNREKSPFEFKPFDLASFNFVINGSNRPTNPLTYEKSDSSSCYAHIFSQVYEALGYHDAIEYNTVTQESFIKDKFFILHDLTSFNLGLSDINEVSQNVSIGVRGYFKKPLPHIVTCVLYMLIPSRFEVSGNRTVTLVF